MDDRDLQDLVERFIHDTRIVDETTSADDKAFRENAAANEAEQLDGELFYGMLDDRPAIIAFRGVPPAIRVMTSAGSAYSIADVVRVSGSIIVRSQGPFDDTRSDEPEQPVFDVQVSLEGLGTLRVDAISAAEYDRVRDLLDSSLRVLMM
jgi:hypothetical protein